VPQPWAKVPLSVWRQAWQALQLALEENGWAVANYRWGYEAGYDRGYEQAEADMAEAWVQSVATARGALRGPSACVLDQRRGEHPPAGCGDEWCPYQTAEQRLAVAAAAERRLAAADGFCARLAERQFRDFYDRQPELPR